MRENPYFTKKSFIVMAIVLAVAVCFCLWFYGSRKSGNTVRITHDGEIFGTYQLSDDQVIEIKDENGVVTNTVRIEGGSVYMESADCPDRICVNQGKKSKDGETITCLPNRVVVEVSGDDRSSVDTMTD